MPAFKTLLRVLALIPLATGALDLLQGLPGQRLIGAAAPAETLADPLLNSQSRFFAAIWLGFGAALWYAAGDGRRHAPLLRLLLAAVFLGGIGRAISLLQLGWPHNDVGTGFVIATGALELLGMPALLWWHRRLLAQPG